MQCLSTAVVSRDIDRIRQTFVKAESGSGGKIC